MGAETIRRSTAFALAAEALRALFTAGLTLYLVRALGPDEYGIYAVAVGVAALLRLVADLGISTSASRFVAEAAERPASAAAVVADALRLKLLLGIGLAVALVALAGPVADAYGIAALDTPLRLVGAVVLFQSLFQLAVSVSIGLGRNEVQARLYLTEGLVETLVAVAAVLLGGGAAGAVGGRAAGFAVAALLGLAVLLRLLGRGLLPGRRAGADTGRIARYGGLVFVVEGAYTLFEQIDVLLLGSMKGAAAAGLFLAPMRMVTTAELPGRAVANAVAPRLAGAGALDPERMAAFQRSLRVLILAGALLAAGTLAWAEPAVRLALGGDYDESARVLRTLTPFVLLALPGPLLTVTVTYLGLAGRRVPVVVGMVVLQVLLDLILIPPLGIVGPAVATDAVFALYIGFHVWILRGRVPLDLRGGLLTLCRALVAGAAMAGVLVAFGTGADLAVWRWVAGLPAGAGAFALVLLATGELRVGELRALTRRVRHPFAR